MNGTTGKKLISRVEFATLAGVTPAAVTKACKGVLVPAIVGKRIDAAHPAVLKYLSDRAAATTEGPATGIDPLYEKAVALCFEKGRYTPRFIRDSLRIGADRSNKILNQMRAAGLVPEPAVTSNEGDFKKQAGTLDGRESPRVATIKENPGGEPFLKKFVESRTPRPRLRDPLPPEPEPPEIKPYSYPDEIGAFLDFTLRDILSRFGTVTSFSDWLDATKTIEMIEEKRLKNAVTRGELISRVLVKNNFINPINEAHIKLLTDGAKTIARRVTAMHGAGTPLDEIEKWVVDSVSGFIKPVKSKMARALDNV